jgi:uncharacterized protein (TIGR02266 family)
MQPFQSRDEGHMWEETCADEDGAEGPGRGSFPSLPVVERRAVSRRVVAGSATLAVKVSLAGETQFFAGLAGDVSRGGLFVATFQVLALGTDVALAFTLPGAGVLHARGVVRWARPAGRDAAPGLGIAFTGLPPECARVIEQFCAVRPPLYMDLDERSIER